MDPFSSVGLVASIVTFIETGVKIISVVKELKGRDGATAENQRAEFLAAHMKALAEDLSLQNAATSTPDEVRLMELTQECQCLARDLLELLHRMRGTSPRAILKNIFGSGTITSLQKRLERCQLQLSVQLTHMLRCVAHYLYESLTCSSHSIAPKRPTA